VSFLKGNERASAINTKCEEENRTQVCRTREGAKKMNEKGNIECQAVCKPNEPSEKHPPKGYVKNLEDFINELDGNSLVKHTLEVITTFNLSFSYFFKFTLQYMNLRSSLPHKFLNPLFILLFS